MAAARHPKAIFLVWDILFDVLSPWNLATEWVSRFLEQSICVERFSDLQWMPNHCNDLAFDALWQKFWRIWFTNTINTLAVHASMDNIHFGDHASFCCRESHRLHLFDFSPNSNDDDDVVSAGCGGGGRRKQLKHLWPPVSRSALSRLRIHHNLLIFTNIVCISINVDWYIFRLWSDSCRSWCIFIRGQWNSLRRKINNDLRLGWMKLDWAKIWDHYYLLMTSWSSWR